MSWEYRRRVSKISASGTKGIESSPTPRSPAVSKSKFIPQCQNSLIRSFCPCGKLVGEFVEKIVVHECSYDENSTRRQDIEIYYSFVGKIDLPEA